jgi:hypothetical protein
MLNTPFANMVGDPRIPRIGGTTSNALTPISPPSYASFNSTVAGADFQPQLDFGHLREPIS